MNERGETLIEILLSTMVLGLAVSALMFGMGTAATTSGFHARQAQETEAVRNLAAAVKQATYSDCAAEYTPAAGFLPSGYSATIAVTGYASGATFASACPSTGDEGVQRVQVTVSQTDARVAPETVVVVKRKPCPAVPC